MCLFEDSFQSHMTQEVFVFVLLKIQVFVISGTSRDTRSSKLFEVVGVKMEDNYSIS